MRSGDPGSYVLLIHVLTHVDVAIGRLGPRHFPAGDYLYCGSALGGLDARVGRHLRPDKALRWHVDYLLPHATVTGTWVIPSPDRLECATREALCRLGGIPVAGFGSSDCRCPGHLVHFFVAPTLAAFQAALGDVLASALPAIRYRPQSRLPTDGRSGTG